MKIISFVGMPGSGKSEASKIAYEMNIPVISMGDIVRKEAERLNIDQKYCKKIADDLRKNNGIDIIAKKCIPFIKNIIQNEKHSMIVIDGIRSIEEIKYFELVLK